MQMQAPFSLFVFNSVSQLWIVIFIQGIRLRLSLVLSHSMGVYKYFSIKTLKTSSATVSALKMHRHWEENKRGKQVGSLINNQKFGKTSLKL